jgi:hypothetical protein
MLSNFQFSNQSLLQTFLVGQPEFRGILQRPEMEQFRQRVAATCHIGPLDEDETQRYMEHRLKCAGSTGKPTFEHDTFPAIHKASYGIPRRINRLCDRLLLLGFMQGRSHLTLDDVKAVLADIAQESEIPRSSEPAPLDSQPARLTTTDAGPTTGAGSLDISRLKLSVAEVDGLSSEIAALNADHHTDRLQRLERSMMRLERINLQTLALLQKLVDAVKSH